MIANAFLLALREIRNNLMRAALTTRGHQIRVTGDYAAIMGGGQAVERDFSTGVNFGASDPRKDGEAIPEPLPQQ